MRPLGGVQGTHQDAVRVRGHARGQRRERPEHHNAGAPGQGRPPGVARPQGPLAREHRGRRGGGARKRGHPLHVLLPDLGANRAPGRLPGGQAPLRRERLRRAGLGAVLLALAGRNRGRPRAGRHELLPHQRTRGHPRRGRHLGRRAVVRNPGERHQGDRTPRVHGQAGRRGQRQAFHLRQGPRERQAQRGRGQRVYRPVRLRQVPADRRRGRQPDGRLRSQADLRRRERRAELGGVGRRAGALGTARRQGRQGARVRRRGVLRLRGRRRAEEAHRGAAGEVVRAHRVLHCGRRGACARRRGLRGRGRGRPGDRGGQGVRPAAARAHAHHQGGGGPAAPRRGHLHVRQLPDGRRADGRAEVGRQVHRLDHPGDRDRGRERLEQGIDRQMGREPGGRRGAPEGVRQGGRRLRPGLHRPDKGRAGQGPQGVRRQRGHHAGGGAEEVLRRRQPGPGRGAAPVHRHVDRAKRERAQADRRGQQGVPGRRHGQAGRTADERRGRG